VGSEGKKEREAKRERKGKRWIPRKGVSQQRRNKYKHCLLYTTSWHL